MNNDQDLISRANLGDERAMFTLYENHKEFCFNLANRYLNDREESLDVLQETFKYFFSKFPGFVLTCQLRTFLFPVVRNLCMSRLRKKKPQVDPQILDFRESETIRDPEVDKNRVIDMVAGLGEEHRDVIILRFADQLTLEEIADKLSVPKGTVKSRLHHALKKLRDNPHFVWLVSMLNFSDF